MAFIKTVSTDIKQFPNEYMLIACMIVFIVSNLQLPEFISEIVSSSFGKITLFAVVVLLAMRHPVLGVVSILFAYQLLHRSEVKTGEYQIRQYEPSQQKRDKRIIESNYIPSDILEEQMIHDMIPYAEYEDVPEPTTFLPVSNKLHNATRV